MRAMNSAVALITILLTGAAGMSDAMGQGAGVRKVICEAETGGAELPEGLCTDFLAQLEAARPDLRFRGGEPAALRLVVEENAPGMFRARIDLDGKRGTPMGTARRGAPLDDAARRQLLGTLIAQLDF